MSRHHDDDKTSEQAQAKAKKDEKRVKETSQTFDVEPEPRPGKPEHPTHPAAVDRRRQIVDENDERAKNAE